jgi:hypothetical protein
MTEAIVIAGLMGLVLGIAIGRLWAVGHHHEHAFGPWRDRVIGAALLPRAPHLLELTADEVKP